MALLAEIGARTVVPWVGGKDLSHTQILRRLDGVAAIEAHAAPRSRPPRSPAQETSG